MKLLVVAPNYPCPGYRFSGIFNQRSVYALSKVCDEVEVLSPRPYVPPLISSLVPRWKAYGSITEYEIRDGISVYRPITPVVPGVAQAFWTDLGVFLWCRRLVRKLHCRGPFDAIISFDLGGAGGLTWRIARDLNIPASGWATGSDVRVRAFSAHARVVTRALEKLDLVFYQSSELVEKAAALLGISAGQLSRERHVVLPRGIPDPPSLPRTHIRNRVRGELGIKTDQIMVLYVGRIARGKGILELLEALSSATSRDSRIRGVLVGSKPGLDDTGLVKKKLHDVSCLGERVMLLPECGPDMVWEYLCAAEIFAFPSHKEGMPNSLLEAMAMSIASVAFAIPPVQELEAGTGGLVLVPPLDCRQFADAVLSLAASPDERKRMGEKGKALVSDRFMVDKNMAKAVRRLSGLVDQRACKNKRIYGYV